MRTVKELMELIWAEQEKDRVASECPHTFFSCITVIADEWLDSGEFTLDECRSLAPLFMEVNEKVGHNRHAVVTPDMFGIESCPAPLIRGE